ncbi:MAG: lipopolysaccharide biosynthesis protein [Desulfobacteraceae bacterium]|nr:lipopolysaccharide biosynthesis protein [Desulfobacteraceae bacterium]
MTDKAQHTEKSGDNIAARTKEGILWTVFFDAIQFIIRFCGSIIVARILFPEDFGLMAIISIILQLARRLTNFGFNMVLIQHKEISNKHFETAFVTNLFLMGILVTILFFGAPFIADFFDNNKIELITRVIGFNFILEAFSSVQFAMLRRDMKFKKLESANAISESVAILSPVGFAIAGLGVWSLVFGSILGAITKLAVVTYHTRWIPKFKFYSRAFKDLFAFGAWIYIGSYIKYGINKIDFFIVGKMLNAAQLGFYERAFNLMSFPRIQIAQKLNTVLFSAYSRIQDDNERLVRGLLQIITYVSVITYPLMTWMFFAAPSLITVLFGSRWAPSVYPFQVMCIAGVLDTLTLCLEPILLARGLVGHRTRRDIIYLVILGSCVYFGIRWGINGVAWGTTVASVFRLALMLQISVSNLGISAWKFFRVQISSIIYTSILALVLMLLQFLAKPYFQVDSWIMLICTTVLSGIALISVHFIIRFKDVDEIFQELFAELKKFAAKLPIIKRIEFITNK